MTANIPEAFVLTAENYVREIFGTSAKRIGAGVQADVYVVKNDAVLKGQFEKLHWRRGALPRRRYVCLKLRTTVFTSRPGHLPRDFNRFWVREETAAFDSMSYEDVRRVWRSNVKAGKREYKMLEHMQETRSARDPCWFRPQDLAPQPYFEGADMDNGVHVLAMEFKRSGEVDMHLPEALAHVEKAVLTMWYAGVIHSDLHHENVLMDPRSKAVTILDFGYARVLPSTVCTQLRQKITPVVNALRKGDPVDVRAFVAALWHELIKPYEKRLHNYWVIDVAHTFETARRRVRRNSRLVTARKRAWACVARRRPA